MKTVSLIIEDYLYEFYRAVDANAGGIKPERVMADALFKLAGELSLNALGGQAGQDGQETHKTAFLID